MPVAHRSLRRTARRLERAVMPPAHTARGKRQFHRLVLVIAGLALAFFLPSLTIAGVPQERWLEFTTVAAAASVILLGTLLRDGLSTRERLAVGFIVGVTVAGVTRMDAGYFNQGPLLFAMLGRKPGHDPRDCARRSWPCSSARCSCRRGGARRASSQHHRLVNAGLYLAGAAVVPWTAAAVRRSAVARAADASSNSPARPSARRPDAGPGGRDQGRASSDHVGQRRRSWSCSWACAAMTGSGGARPRASHAAMLHDVGKLHVPDGILLKPGALIARNGRLCAITPSGASGSWVHRGLRAGAPDGTLAPRELGRTGYPDGLHRRRDSARGAHRAPRGRFDALRSPRPYRFAWSLEDVLRHLREQSGTAL